MNTEDCKDNEDLASMMLKQQQKQQEGARKQGSINMGMGGGIVGMQEPARAGLRDRVERQRYQAVQDARRADQLGELLDLIDKHPHIARILDLLEIVRG
jgi:hypothetical protein